MLVGARQEMHIIPVQPLEARHCIRRNSLVSVAQVRAAVHIGYGRGNIIRRLRAHQYLRHGGYQRLRIHQINTGGLNHLHRASGPCLISCRFGPPFEWQERRSR